MKRRNFFKTLAGIAVLPILPETKSEAGPGLHGEKFQFTMRMDDMQIAPGQCFLIDINNEVTFSQERAVKGWWNITDSYKSVGEMNKILTGYEITNI